MINWLRAHKFESHLTAFILMVLTPIGLYFAANTDTIGLVWVLLGVFVLANLLAIFLK